jgi:hypothetical protein
MQSGHRVVKCERLKLNGRRAIMASNENGETEDNGEV